MGISHFIHYTKLLSDSLREKMSQQLKSGVIVSCSDFCVSLSFLKLSLFFLPSSRHKTIIWLTAADLVSICKLISICVVHARMSTVSTAE